MTWRPGVNTQDANDRRAYLGSPGSSQPGRAAHSWPATQHCQESEISSLPSLVSPAAAFSLTKTIPPPPPSTHGRVGVHVGKKPGRVETNAHLWTSTTRTFCRLRLWFGEGGGAPARNSRVADLNAPIRAEQHLNAVCCAGSFQARFILGARVGKHGHRTYYGYFPGCPPPRPPIISPLPYASPIYGAG